MASIKITIDGVTAVAELNDVATRGSEKVLSSLPLTTRMVHASRSGNCAVVQDETLRDDSVAVENQVSMYYPGMVAYDPARGYLVLAYGQGQARSRIGTHWVTYLGDITQGRDQLVPKLQETRDGDGAREVRIERED